VSVRLRDQLTESFIGSVIFFSGVIEFPWVAVNAGAGAVRLALGTARGISVFALPARPAMPTRRKYPASGNWNPPTVSNPK
jgi:hypothetical protein